MAGVNKMPSGTLAIQKVEGWSMVRLPNFKSKIGYLVVGGMMIGAVIFGLQSLIFSTPSRDTASIVINEAKLEDGLLEKARNNDRILIIVTLNETLPRSLEKTVENEQRINTERQDAVIASLVTGKLEVIRRWSVSFSFGGYADLNAILELQAHPLVISIISNDRIYSGELEIGQEISGDIYE